MQSPSVQLAFADTEMKRVRQDFPALQQQIHGQPLVYLDNAASAQKPRAVLDRIREFYEHEYSNIHRGVHELSQRATQAYEEARISIANHIAAPEPAQVIFTRGTTESINLVAATYGRMHVAEGDEILISTMEHHSNIVPWQLLCQEKKASLKVIPVSDEGEIIYEAYQRLLNNRTKLVAIPHISNALGTINPVHQMIEDAHALDIPVLIDGAQAMPHMSVNVQNLDADFYCFSGHKMFGPSGIGVLYGKKELLEDMPPYQGGGDMIETVSFEHTTFNVLPHKFEAGTPHIAGGVGLGAAVDYMRSIGMSVIEQYEKELLAYATERLLEIDGLRIYGTAREKASVVSFLLDGIHPYDTGTILDQLGIAVRTGHHCTQPLMKRFNIPGTVRASLAFYNTTSDVDALVNGLHRAKKILS